jgi:hypothetical protein
MGGRPGHSRMTEALRQRIQAGLHYGTLRGGQRLPSLREVARELYTNPRAVMAAYRQLAAEGLVCVRPRSGIFVESASDAGEPAPDVVEGVVDLFLRGLARGCPPTALRRQIRSCLEGRHARVACLECNDDQIYALCQQAHRDYGFDAVAVDTAALAERRSLPLAGMDLVLTTRFHSEEAERLGRRLGCPVLVATLDPVFVTEVRRLQAAGTVWWICTDPRFADKLPRIFPGGSVQPVVLGKRPPDHIPPGDMVYATRRAAGRLPPGWRGGRVTTIPRVFSAETARALLVFQLGRNLRTAERSGRPGRRAVPVRNGSRSRRALPPRA